MRIKAADLEQAVLANVNLMANIYAEKKARLKLVPSEVSVAEALIESLVKEKNHLSSEKMRLYEQYRSGGSREEYIRKKNENEKRLAEVGNELQEAECRLEVAKQDEINSSDTEQILSNVVALQTFDKENLKKVIDRVNVYSKDEIEIIWKPMDVIFMGISADKTSINLSGNP